MFPSRYFADRYFAARYWAKVGSGDAPTIISGPFYVAASQAYTAGSVRGQSYVAGSVSGQGFVAGSVKGQSR